MPNERETMKIRGLQFTRMIPGLALSLAACLALSPLARAGVEGEGETAESETSDRVVVFGSFDPAIQSLIVTAPSGTLPIGVAEGGDRFYIQGHLLNASDAHNYSRASFVQVGGDHARVTLAGNIRACRSPGLSVAIKTTPCLDSLVISVPEDSKARLVINGRIARLVTPMRPAELIFGLKLAETDKTRLHWVSEFVRSNEESDQVQSEARFVRMVTVSEALEKFGSDDARIKAARIFSGHAVDRRNAPIAGGAALSKAAQEQIKTLMRR
jgi:hypothetical protein